MGRVRFLKLLLTPSILSGLAVICLAVAIVTSASLLYISENQLFYEYLFGPHGIATDLIRAPDSPSALWNAISGSLVAYYILLTAVAVIAGFTVLAVLRGVSWVLQTAPSYALQALQEARLAQKDAIKEMFERLLIRVFGLIIAALYAIFFLDVLIPLNMLLLQNGLDDINAWLAPAGGIKVVSAWFIFCLLLHVHIILARLYTLRLRIFGGADLEMAALE